MKPLPIQVVESLHPAAQMPEFRILPYSLEKRNEAREKISHAIAEGGTRVWHLKRLLWHPDHYDSCMNYLMQVGEDDFISIKCIASFGVLTGSTGDSLEVYDKESRARTHYERFDDFLADGWVLD